MKDIINLLAEIKYDGELSPEAYVILTIFFLIIVVGLSWCFYRAICATNKEPEEQLPDEI